MKLFNKTLNNSCEHKNFDKKIFFSFSLLLRGKILTHPKSVYPPNKTMAPELLLYNCLFIDQKTKQKP